MNANAMADIVRLYGNGDSKNGGLKFFISARQARSLGLQPGSLYDLQQRGAQLELVPVDLAVEATDTAWIHDRDPFTPAWRLAGAASGKSLGRAHANLDCAREQEHVALRSGRRLTQTRLGACLAAHVPPCPRCWLHIPINKTASPVEDR